MSWRIVMIEQGDYLKLKLDNLVVKKEGIEYTVPLMDISMIIISNLNSVVTTRLLDSITKYSISLIVCDAKHLPTGVYNGLNTYSRASKVLKKQLQWNEGFKDFTWKMIVTAKIKNQVSVLKLFEKNCKKIDIVENYIDFIELGDKTNREGHAAKVYFNSLFGIKFTRGDDENIYNMCLNYIYAVVRAFVARLIVAYGFTGLIGIHHKNEYNNFNLVDDLMEPFRPICDKYVLENINEDTVFDFNTRYVLIEFLYKKISYTGQKMMISNVMEKYIQGFIKYCNYGEIEALIFPEVE